MDESSICEGCDSSELIRRVVQSRSAEIRDCYERQLRRDHRLQGRVVLSFRIGTDGKVPVSEIRESDLGSTEVELCIVERSRHWNFPAELPDAPIRVNYPFQLHSTI